jgi:hypothetical protein
VQRAIIKAATLRRETAWPVTLAQDDEVDAWLDRVQTKRQQISDEKLYQRLITDMSKTEPRSGVTSGRHYNFKILEAIERYEGVQWDDLGRFHHSFHNALPPFISDIEMAMTLWPDDARPSVWTGSAWECCIAALKLRRSRWMSAVRVSSEAT